MTLDGKFVCHVGYLAEAADKAAKFEPDCPHISSELHQTCRSGLGR